MNEIEQCRHDQNIVLHGIDLFIEHSNRSIIVVSIRGSHTSASNLEYLKHVGILVPRARVSGHVKTGHSCDYFLFTVSQT